MCYEIELWIRCCQLRENAEFCVAKIIVVFKNKKNCVITKIRGSYLLSLYDTK